MKPNTAPFLICLMLVLGSALGAVTSGRAGGMAVLAATLSPMVICADGAGPQTVLIAQDGTPVDLPPCAGPLCADCLQAGAVALPIQAIDLRAPVGGCTMAVMSGDRLHHPAAIWRARSRAPPLGETSV